MNSQKFYYNQIFNRNGINSTIKHSASYSSEEIKDISIVIKKSVQDNSKATAVFGDWTEYGEANYNTMLEKIGYSDLIVKLDEELTKMSDFGNILGYEKKSIIDFSSKDVICFHIAISKKTSIQNRLKLNIKLANIFSIIPTERKEFFTTVIKTV